MGDARTGSAREATGGTDELRDVAARALEAALFDASDMTMPPLYQREANAMADAVLAAVREHVRTRMEEAEDAMEVTLEADIAASWHSLLLAALREFGLGDEE